MQVLVRNTQGETVDEVELRDDIFGVEPNVPVMHQALVRQLANARLGTHKTKKRGEVRGGGRKPWRQKGTGRARQGSIRAPQWRGGGVVFGAFRIWGPGKTAKVQCDASAMFSPAMFEQFVVPALTEEKTAGIHFHPST